MRYHPSPREFFKDNWSELVQYSAWILCHRGHHLDNKEIINLLVEWYVLRADLVLRSFDPSKGSLETWMRRCLDQGLLYVLNRQNRARLQESLSQSLDEESEDGTEFHELIGHDDGMFEQRLSMIDIREFRDYVSRKQVYCSGLKLRVLNLVHSHTPGEIAQTLGVTKQRISQIMSSIRQDYHRYMAEHV